MKNLLVIITLFAPFCAYAQGGAAVFDNYDDQPANRYYTENNNTQDEEYDHLLTTPLGAYANPFHSLSEYNFSFVRYRNRSYDFRHNKILVSNIDLSDDITGNTLWNLSSAAGIVRQGRSDSYGIDPSGADIGTVGTVRNYNIGANELSCGVYSYRQAVQNGHSF